jgi:hypothetical protein
MLAAAEFFLVALALYLWESGLWLPLRTVGLRRAWRGRTWKVLAPDRLIAVREVGLVPMLLVPPDTGLAPCQVPPLIVDAGGNLGIASGDAYEMSGKAGWEELQILPQHLGLGGAQARIASLRSVRMLSRARRRGDSPAAAVERMWLLALSPVRAAREWRRWQSVARPLAWLGSLLFGGFFGALPLAYFSAGMLGALAVAVALWLLMLATALYLWWLGRRVYPDARAALRADGWLALVLPMHAMRGLEIAAVHALATTHPAALLVAGGDCANPWLAGFLRRLRHPRPGHPGDAALSSSVAPLAARLFAGRAAALMLDRAPSAGEDPEARRWCPRCHALFVAGVASCADCQQVELRDL